MDSRPDSEEKFRKYIKGHEFEKNFVDRYVLVVKDILFHASQEGVFLPSLVSSRVGLFSVKNKTPNQTVEKGNENTQGLGSSNTKKNP